jgi:hypothetical protein
MVSEPPSNVRSCGTGAPFGVITQMWLALFVRLLQMVSELPSNARSCGTGALHKMALTRTLGV